MRVWAIEKTDNENKIVYLYGKGVMEGEFPCPGLIKYLLAVVDEWLENKQITEEKAWDYRNEFSKKTNPRIRLDDGTIVWGYQCWWGDEAKCETKYAGYKVENVKLDEI